MITQTKNKEKAIHVIYNDDCAVLDALADLKDREPIHGLDRFIRFSNQGPICLLYNCPPDNLVVLILYKAPLGWNERPNNLILFICADLEGMYAYFKRWIENTDPHNGDVYGALSDILNCINVEYVRQREDNVQSDFLG